MSGDGETADLTERIPLGRDAKLWDEFDPNLYTVTCRLATTAGGRACEHEKSAVFGLREWLRAATMCC